MPRRRPSRLLKSCVLKSDRRGRPEDDEQRFHVMPMYANAGFDVYVNSTRNKPVGVTPGIPDLEVFAVAFGFGFRHEVKVEGRRQSYEQRVYQERCDAVGVPYVLGDREAAEDFLVWFGLAFWTLRGAPGVRVIAGTIPGGGWAGYADGKEVPRSEWIFQKKVDARTTPAASSGFSSTRALQLMGWKLSQYAIAQRARWGHKLTPAELIRLSNRVGG